MKVGSGRAVPRRRVDSGGEERVSDADSALPVPRGSMLIVGRTDSGGSELRSSNRSVSPESSSSDCARVRLSPAASVCIEAGDVVACTVYAAAGSPCSASSGFTTSSQKGSAVPVPDPADTITLMSTSAGSRCGGSAASVYRASSAAGGAVSTVWCRRGGESAASVCWSVYEPAAADGSSEIMSPTGMRSVPSERPAAGSKCSAGELPLKVIAMDMNRGCIKYEKYI